MEIFIPRDVKDMNDMMKQCKTSYIVSPFMLKSYGIATIEAAKILNDNKVDVIFDITGLIAIVAKKMNLDIKISKHSPYKDKIINMTTKEFDFYDHNINDLIHEVMLGINQKKYIQINEIFNCHYNNKYFYGQKVKVKKRYLPSYIYYDYSSFGDQEYINGVVSYIGRHGCTVVFNEKKASLPYGYIEKADLILGDSVYIVTDDGTLTLIKATILELPNTYMECLIAIQNTNDRCFYNIKNLIKLDEDFIRRIHHDL